MLIRPAAPADLAAVGEVTAAAYAPFTLGPDDPYVARLRDAASRAEQAELWVAVTDDPHGPGEVLGSVTTCPPGSPWREIAEPGEGEFRMLSVAPGAQGQGVGSALVDIIAANLDPECRPKEGVVEKLLGLVADLAAGIGGADKKVA